MEHLITILSTLRIVGAVLAAVLVFQAVRAWRRSNETRMLRLSIGFALVLFSVLIEGAIFQFGLSLQVAHIVEAGTQVAAMAVFVWALY